MYGVYSIPSSNYFEKWLYIYCPIKYVWWEKASLSLFLLWTYKKNINRRTTLSKCVRGWTQRSVISLSSEILLLGIVKRRTFRCRWTSSGIYFRNGFAVYVLENGRLCAPLVFAFIYLTEEEIYLKLFARTKRKKKISPLRKKAMNF